MSRYIEWALVNNDFQKVDSDVTEDPLFSEEMFVEAITDIFQSDPFHIFYRYIEEE